MGRIFAVVAALLAVSAVEAQQPLKVMQAADSIAVTGDHFAATWKRDAGWQLAGVEVKDFQGAFRIDGERDDMLGMGALVIRCGGKTYFACRGSAPAPRIVDESEDLLVFTVELTPRSADGAECPLRVSQKFSVFGEGAIFCDFTLALAEGAGEITVDDVEVGMALQTAELKHLRWDWKRTWQGKVDVAREVTLKQPEYLRVLGATIGRERPYTNHVEMFVEEKKSLNGEAKGMSCEVTDDSGGAKRFSWHLGGPVKAKAEFAYSNRFGLALGHLRMNDNAIGQRIAHWQEGNAHLMTYPSDSAIEALAECGVSICILHLYWSRRGWGNYEPFDEQDMRRWVRTCHRHGIKCIVYAVPADNPGTKGINRGWIRDLELDGIYFDFGSVHFRGSKPGGAIAGYGREFPALDFLKLTRHYREAVGPKGIIISHSGGAAPDALFHLNLNAYLPGEAGVQGGLLSNFRAAAYHSGMAYAVVHPWCEYGPFQTQHGAATYCAIGGFPHILFGRGTHQDNNYHRSVYRSGAFALPYWQILSTIPMDKATMLYTEASGAAASADQPSVQCCVYQRSPELLLVTVSNLGEACAPAIVLNRELLKVKGTYHLLQLGGLDMADFKVTDLGSWTGGPIRLKEMGQDEYVGLLLVQGEMPAHTRAALSRIERLVAAFHDKRPPSVPSGLAADTDLDLVKLSWQPATDEFHVIEYRLYRGPDEAKLERLAVVEEATGYSDYTAPLGSSLVYAVSAVDVAGNESRKSAVVSVSTPGGGIGPDNLTPVSGHWVQEGGYLRQGVVREPASSAGETIAFAARTARFVRALFTGGSGNYGNAHVVEMTVRDEQGQAIKPVEVITSGSDPGHPETHAADGITDKTRNGWWSDRKRGLPAWVGFDLGKPQSVAGVRLLTYWDGKRYYDYSIEVSEDGQEWTAVGGTPAVGAVKNARALADARFVDGVAGVTTLEIAANRSGGGLLFRCPDANNGYALRLDAGWDGNLVLDKLVDGKLKRLKATFFPYSIHNPIPHRISVECRGTAIRCYCDEVLVFEVDDDTFARGQVGVIVPSGRPLKFVNLFAASS